MPHSIEAFEALKEYMVNVHNAKIVSGGKEITKRCHICGDSTKDMRSKHMYIGIDNRSGLISYNCFKCGSSGIVDGKFLRNMDSMHDVSSIAILCNNHNKEKMNLPQNRALRESEYMKLPNPVFWTRDAKESHSKLNHINSRLGTSFTFDDLGKYKIIINLKDFLYANNINTISRSESVVDYLDTFFSGFLSVDNSYITLRRMVREGVLPEYMDKRYINYNIFNKLNNANRHYIVPCNINLMDPRPVKIYIAEGPFDTLSLRVNVVEDIDHTIFAAVGGKSYLVLVKYFIEEYGMTNVEYHLCPDADVPDSKMYWIANILRPLGIRVYIHRNNFPGEKDFGVSRDKINEIIKPLF